MAVNTENRRRAVLGLLGGPRVLPAPDSEIDAGDRAHLLLYRVFWDPVTGPVVSPKTCPRPQPVIKSMVPVTLCRELRLSIAHRTAALSIRERLAKPQIKHRTLRVE